MLSWSIGLVKMYILKLSISFIDHALTKLKKDEVTAMFTVTDCCSQL